jgi:hypothetical protein
VRCLDGQTVAGLAVEGDVEAFQRGWRRPKWAIVERDDPANPTP